MIHTALLWRSSKSKYGFDSESKLDNAGKWYFKDMRSNPIDLGVSADICGEYSSDDEYEDISESDRTCLSKSERRGYLLKRSNTDFNLWRRHYCALADHLWCLDLSKKEIPAVRAKCVKLSGLIRYREGSTTLDQLQIIIVNSTDGKTHFFRACSLLDQKKWIQDMNRWVRINDPEKSLEESLPADILSR